MLVTVVSLCCSVVVDPVPEKNAVRQHPGAMLAAELHGTFAVDIILGGELGYHAVRGEKGAHARWI